MELTKKELALLEYVCNAFLYTHYDTLIEYEDVENLHKKIKKELEK